MSSSVFRICRSVDEIPGNVGPTALSIGNFDGVHTGHRRIFRRVVEIAREHGWKPSVLTFDPHPTKVVAPDRAPRLLSTVEQRCEWMQEAGIEQVFVLPFDERFSSLTAEEFVDRILVAKLGVRAVLVGDNFRFGQGARGDVNLLEELGRSRGFTTEIVHAVTLRKRMISSSAIRVLVHDGHVALASRFLGRPYALEGEVVKGHGVGSKQTVPTLNLRTRAEIIPNLGVYVTHTHDLEDGRRWQSVSNVGYRPTFENGRDLSIETFLLDPFDGRTPNRIRVEFLHRLRPEKRFDSPEQLKAQILRDVARAKKYFRILGPRAESRI